MNLNKEYSCFTMGYSDLPIEAFIYFLKKAKVDTIVDVRSTPYSKYQTQFNRDLISKYLNQENIDYYYMGDRLGGRYSSPEFLFPDGTVNYQLVSSSDEFGTGLKNLIELIHNGNLVSLMCSEKDPLKCHRFVLIARNLQKKGIKVIHLYPELIRKTHIELEKELTNQNNRNNQSSLLGNDADGLELAYKNLNKRIGFKSKGSDISHYRERNHNFLDLNSHNDDISHQNKKDKNKQQKLF